MAHWLKAKSRAFFEAERKKLRWKDGLILAQRSPHTGEIAHLTNCRPGRDSAEYYAAAISLGEMDDREGKDILGALKDLQIRSRDDSRNGAFRWYAEETKVHDSNAAFFILMPLAQVRLNSANQIPSEHLPLLDEMMASSLHWFARECNDPILYYTNKIVSDGALLLAISSLLGSAVHYDQALKFFHRWEEYTKYRGWGWGENCSAIYIRVTLEALRTACLVLAQDEEQIDLYTKLMVRFDQLLDTIRFHGKHEFVPTIRSYNFQGEHGYGYMNWLISGLVSEAEADTVSLSSIKDIHLLSLFDCVVSNDELTSLPRIRLERIFGDSRAYTWIGRNGRMGSINRFPVMPGCYQEDTWGLGWQSFPVSFTAGVENTAYLRWFVHRQGGIRTHPAVSKQGYLESSLFNGVYHPEVQTVSEQSENLLLVVRSISHVNHAAEEIADEWVLHRFGGEVERIDIPQYEAHRVWSVLRYEGATVAITALNGMPADHTSRTAMAIDIVRDGESVRLTQRLHTGGDPIVSHPRLESGWAVVFVDEPMDRATLYDHLSRVKIVEKILFDPEIPRSEAMKQRHISLEMDGGMKVELLVDPFK